MNSSPMSSIIAETTAVDPIAFWRLDEKPRYPTTEAEWDCALELPSRPRIKIVGTHAYDLTVNRKARTPVTHTMPKLVAAFQEDFESASKFFGPTQWRLLYYLAPYSLSTLSNPGFDAVRAFQEIYQIEAPYADVPQEWTGSSESSEDMLWDLRAYRHDPDPDVAKAAWAILSFGRSLDLEKREVLRLPWWQVWWIERCIAAYR